MEDNLNIEDGLSISIQDDRDKEKIPCQNRVWNPDRKRKWKRLAKLGGTESSKPIPEGGLLGWF